MYIWSYIYIHRAPSARSDCLLDAMFNWRRPFGLPNIEYKYLYIITEFGGRVELVIEN